MECNAIKTTALSIINFSEFIRQIQLLSLLFPLSFFNGFYTINNKMNFSFITIIVVVNI